MINQRQQLVLGGALVGTGLLALVNNLGLLEIEAELVVSLLFLAAGGFVMSRFHRTGSVPALLVGAMLLFIGSAIFIEATGLVDDDYIAVVLFWGAAGLCGYGFLRNQEKWGWLIPAGVLFTLGTLVILDESRYLDDDLMGGTFFLGVGLTFSLLYLIRNERNRLEWAQIPALFLVLFSGLVYLKTVEVEIGAYLFPSILVATGTYLVLRSLWGRRKLGQA